MATKVKKTKRLTRAEKMALVEIRKIELFEQIGWSHDLWGAGEQVEQFLRSFQERDVSDLDSIHFELERLTELVGLFRDQR